MSADRTVSKRRPALGPRLLIAAAGVAVIAALIGIASANEALVERLRNVVFDSYQRIAPRVAADAPIAVVDIDESSIAALGQWPWPRTVIAQLVEALGDAGAATIAFDMTFSEPDRTSPSTMLAGLLASDATINLPPGLEMDNDAVLARAFAAHPVVAGFAISNETDSPLPPAKAGSSFGGADPRNYLPAYAGGISNLPELNEAAPGIGFFSFPRSIDGVVRALPLVAAGGGNLYPAFAVEALRVAQGASGIAIRSTGASGEADTGRPAMTALRVGALTLPTGPNGEFVVHYSGLPDMPTVSAAEILQQPGDGTWRDQVAGRIVLVGTSAVGLRDLVATPVASAEPGVRVHAEIIDQIIGQQFLSRPDWAAGAEVALAVLLGVLSLGFCLFAGAVLSAAAAIALVGAAAATSWWAFWDAQLLLDPVLPGLVAAAVFATATPLMLLSSDREKRFVRRAFARYLSPQLVERLAADPSALQLGGELREISILFSDIRDFTSISEALTPDELTALLNGFLTPATEALLATEATIDKYIGDAIVAFWNAPLDIADHRRKACIAALRVVSVVDELNQAGALKLRVGIGLNTGVCCVGNFGSAQRFSYSAIGDSMNLTARVESLTKQYRVPILATEETRNGASELAFVEVDRVSVVGRKQPVPIFALLGDAAHARTTSFLDYAAAQQCLLDAYRALDFRAADRALADARQFAPEAVQGLYDVYATRIAEMHLEPPPADWDGVFVAKQK